MPEFNWVPVDYDETLIKIKEESMKILPISCTKYRYWGVGRFPEIKLTVKAKTFYANAGDI